MGENGSLYVGVEAHALNEKTPLIPHLINPYKPITNDGPTHPLVQECFDQAADMLKSKGKRRSEWASYSNRSLVTDRHI